MREILIGTVLGDGYLEPHGKGVRLQVVHSASQREYVEWKHQSLKEISPTPLYYYHGTYPFWRFVTSTHPYLAELREIFYSNGKKVVPNNIGRLLDNPLSLAVWFMDDGTCDRRQGSILFETQSFSRFEIERLKCCLAENFDIESSIHKSGKNRGLRLYLTVEAAQKLKTIIELYVLPTMKYKLP